MVKTIENERKYNILNMLVDEYVDTAEPVGSEGLCAKYRLSWSPATIRNDFSVLEEEGYIAKPHTSGGRIPTHQAYRKIRDEALEREAGQTWDPFTAARMPRSRLQVADNAPAAAARMLSALTDHVVLAGLLENDLLAEFGLPALFREPEFADRESVANVASFVERVAHEMEDVVGKVLREELAVFIGEENAFKEIRSCSLLITGFASAEGERGFIGILGPTRMRYERNIAFLEQVAGALGKR